MRNSCYQKLVIAEQLLCAWSIGREVDYNSTLDLIAGTKVLNRIRSFFTDPEYYRTLIRLAVPIALQSLISSSLNFVSVFMIGQLGEVPIASIGLANQIWFLLNLMVFGISSGTSMFVAQLWGKRDVFNIRRVVGVTVKLGMLAAIIFFTIAFFFPQTALRVYSTDPAVIATGARFLRIHRNCLVASARIREIGKLPGEDDGHFLRLDGLDERLMVSRRQYSALRERIRAF